MTEENTPSRPRASGVRATILTLLAQGPLSMEEMSSKGQFSVQSGFLNVKKLKEEGLLTTQREGRTVRYVLSESAGTSESLAKKSPRGKSGKKRGRPARKTVTADGISLKDALTSLSNYLAPIDNLKEKLSVIDQLVNALPAPVAKVLSSIKADLQARSGVISGGG